MTIPTVSPEYTSIHDLDSQVQMLVSKLSGSSKTEPDERIQIAEAILMLQHDRKQMVKEIMTRLYGAKQ